MKLYFIKKNEKRKILSELEKFYGIADLKYLLIEVGKKRIRAFSGNLTKEEIFKLSGITNIESIGLYIANKRDEVIRINFDAIPILKNKITKNLVEINKEQLELWLRGHDLEIKTERGPVILKFEDDLVGLGKSNSDKIFNYVPKERKLKIPLPIARDLNFSPDYLVTKNL